MNLIERFVRRLKKIGIDITLSANYPWVYLDEVNGLWVGEKFRANHGFTAFFITDDVKWSDRRVVFQMIRQKVKQKNALDEMAKQTQEWGLE